MKLDNLDYSVTLEQLKELFGKHGEIGDVYMPRDYYTKRSRGFAFVRFKDRTAAEVRTRSFVSSADPPRRAQPARTLFCIRRRSQNRTPTHPALSVLINPIDREAIKEFDQKELNGRPIACRFAEKPRPDNPREPYRGGGRGGRGVAAATPTGAAAAPYGGSYSSRRPYGGDDDYGPSRGAYREVYDRRDRTIAGTPIAAAEGTTTTTTKTEATPTAEGTTTGRGDTIAGTITTTEIAGTITTTETKATTETEATTGIATTTGRGDTIAGTSARGADETAVAL